MEKISLGENKRDNEKISLITNKNESEMIHSYKEQRIGKSWIKDKNSNDESYIATKIVDKTVLNNKNMAIPNELHDKFLKNSTIISKKCMIIDFNNKEYECTVELRDYDESENQYKTIRVWLKKELVKILTGKFKYSYEYLVNQKDKNNKDIKNEYIEFYKSNEENTVIIKLISNEDIDANDIYTECEIMDDEMTYGEEGNLSEILEYIHRYISSKGFDYSIDLIKNFYLSLKTKPFVILSGISGTGKSKIAELFAEAIGATTDNNRFKLIPVKPDWSDATDLLGYRNIEGKFTAGVITRVAKEAIENPELPYFICLDEMNLARVEYYFSDILSLMETRKLNDEGNIVTERLISKEQFGKDEEALKTYGHVYIPDNLYIVGTVNMDETTFPFSKKVLDRANTIEFNKVNLDFSFEDITIDNIEIETYGNDFLKAEYLKLVDCKDNKEIVYKTIAELKSINDILEEYNQHFGFRVRDEIVFYMTYAANNESPIISFNEALDYCIVQKILPKINGSNGDVLEILIKLYNLLNNKDFNESYLEDSEIKKMIEINKDSNYKNTSEKLVYMIRRFLRDGFTTFWQ